MSFGQLPTVRPRKHPNVSINAIRPTIFIDSDGNINYDKLYKNGGLDFIPVRPAQTNNIESKKKNSKCSTKTVKKYVQDYCEGTSLHGLRYIGIPEVTLFERIFWLISFIGAIGFSAYFISNIYEKWIFTPVIVGINSRFKSVDEIPFPAITICNMNQIRKPYADKILAGDNEVDKTLIYDICNFDNATVLVNNISKTNSTDWQYIKKFMLKVSQPCTDLLQHCSWKGEKIECSKILNPALTDEGLCCTFNKVNSKYMYHNPWIINDFNLTFPDDNIDWTPEAGYPEDSSPNTWPFRAAGAGQHIGLSLIVDVAAEDYFCSSTSSVGLKIRLHSPVESPMMSDYGFFIHPRKEVRVALRPTMDEASPTINNIPINKRQCYFSNERSLYFFRTYTKLNCELECLSNYTLQKCGCVPYYLPKNHDSHICDKSQDECHIRAKSEMDLELRPSVYCTCLPACNEITFGQDHSLGDISKPELRSHESSSIIPSNLIILHFFYPQTQFRSYQKSELFGFTEFLSNSGGLLGLFLGFSFLSAVEICYHLTLKLWCTYYRNWKKDDIDNKVIPFTK